MRGVHPGVGKPAPWSRAGCDPELPPEDRDCALWAGMRSPEEIQNDQSDFTCDLALAGIQAKKRQFGGIGAEEKRAGDMPRIGTAKISVTENSVNLRSQGSVRENPADPGHRRTDKFLRKRFAPDKGQGLREQQFAGIESKLRNDAPQAGIGSFELEPDQQRCVDVCGSHTTLSRDPV